MKLISRYFYKLRGWVLEHLAKKKISKLEDGVYRLTFDIPYVSQYESREYAAPDEYIFWAPKLCGMACFKMILKATKLWTSDGPAAGRASDVPIVDLGKKAMAAGCYAKDPTNAKRLIGMLHKPFLKFAGQYGLAGKLLWYIGANAVAKKILDNNFVIASVHYDIRHAGARPESKMGHLVLVHGFEIKNGEIAGFYIHNPSGFYGISQENHFIPVDDFIHCFSGRIIVLL